MCPAIGDPFHSAVCLREGNQSSNTTSYESPENKSMGGALPIPLIDSPTDGTVCDDTVETELTGEQLVTALCASASCLLRDVLCSSLQSTIPYRL